MADDHAFDNSVIIEDYFAYPQTIENGKEDPAPKTTNLTFSGKEFAWQGSIEQLRDFLKYNLKLEGKWTSPGGDTKLFTSCDYTVKWYGRIKKKLAVVRDDHNQSLVEKLEKFATVFSDRSSINTEVGQENMADENVEKSSNLLAFDADDYSQHNTSRYEAEKISAECCPNSNNSCGCYCKDFTLQIKRIEDEIKSLQYRLKDDYTTTLPCNNDLLLRRENVRLQSDLESAKSAIKQLETKVHELQSEKASLITVIRLMQEDGQHGNYSDKKNNTNDQEDSPWTVVKKPKRKKKKSKRAIGEKLSDASLNTATKDNTPQSVEQNATYNSNDQGKTPGNNDNIQTEISGNKNTKTPEPAKVIIAGDSMIKHLNGYRMSTKETRVQIATFPGATTLDMIDHIKPIQRKRPDKLILHVGTNNLRGRGTPSKHAEEIISLAESVKNTLPETEILISGLINRVDDDALGNKVNQVNTALKQMCYQHHWKFIEHSNIIPSHLNRSGIHLNKMGTAKLSRNFNKYIYNKND